MRAITTLKKNGVALLMRDPKSFAMVVFSIPAIVAYCVCMPIFCAFQGLANFSHGFAALMLGVLPVILTMAVSWVLMAKDWQKLQHFSRWDWLSLAVLITVGHWLLFMGAIFVSIFIFPASVLDQIAGAFYYYMVPLCGIEWVVLACNMAVVMWVYRVMVVPSLHRHAYRPVYWHAKPVVLTVWPASLFIYGAFQFLFYHFVPA